MTPIASFIPQEIDYMGIEALLETVGVISTMEGSRAYQLSVRHEDIEKAIAVLKESTFANKINFYF
jgi:hypothetical protein